MAGDGDGEIEYESDPEEAKISLNMRRKEASDDEDSDTDEKHGDFSRSRVSNFDSDGEFDDQGGVAEYNDEDDDDDEEEDEEEEEEEEEDGGGGVETEVRVVELKVVEDFNEEGCELVESDVQGGEEKKVNEPFSVPTSGAFYMHDDRFRDSSGARNRRTFGGGRLWESKDDRKWGHDKFEEMNIQDRHYDEGKRSSKGYYRGRGRGRGTDGGRGRGTDGGRGRGTDSGRGSGTDGGRIRAYGGNSNQNLAPKDVRGRGPRRYQPFMKNKSETLPPHNKLSAKSTGKSSNAGSGRSAASIANPNIKYEPVPARKVASNLNYASPPFYPSGSSNKDISQTPEEVQAANHSRNLRTSVVDHNTSMLPSNSSLRGKNVVDSFGMGNLHIDDSVSPDSSKPLNNVHLASSASSSSSAVSQSGSQGRGLSLSGSSVFRPLQTNDHVSKVPPPAAQAPLRNSVQNQSQDSSQSSVQQLAQRSLVVSQGPSLKAGKGNAQGAGKGTLMYAGAQVIGSGGNMGAGRGDQNLPTFFPVMQFGAQHPGGMGVPAVGMAVPGYVAQPNGEGNSGMTWLPVLASAAGAMGATYCPPYISVDGTFHPRPTAQTPALPAPSKDNNLIKTYNEVMPLQKSEVSNDELIQRQNKPRRYSEMSFSQ